MHKGKVIPKFPQETGLSLTQTTDNILQATNFLLINSLTHYGFLYFYLCILLIALSLRNIVAIKKVLQTDLITNSGKPNFW